MHMKKNGKVTAAGAADATAKAVGGHRLTLRAGGTQLVVE